MKCSPCPDAKSFWECSTCAYRDKDQRKPVSMDNKSTKGGQMPKGKDSNKLSIIALIIAVAALIIVLVMFFIRPTEPTTNTVPVANSLPPANNNVTVVKPSPTEISFDGCGFPVDYLDKDWFDAFNKTYEEAAGYAAFPPITGLGIEDMCYSVNGNLVVTLETPDYSEANRIFKYDILTDTIEQATLDDGGYDFQAGASEFGLREGSVIHLAPAITGDAGECATFYYDYHVDTNVIEYLNSDPGCEI